MSSTTRTTVTAVAAAIGIGQLIAPAGAEARQGRNHDEPVSVEVLRPGGGHNAGISGAGWFVDLEVDFPAAAPAAT